jgi:hypothetical protein
MIKKSTLIPVIFALLTAGMSGQPFSTVKDVDILEDELLVLDLDYPHRFDTVAILGAFPLGEKHTRIIYNDQGIYCEAIVNKDRKDLLLVATAVEIPRSEVPDIVMHVVRDGDYGSWNIDRTLAIRTPYGPWFYAIDVTNNSDEERLFYDERGGYVDPPY